MYTVDFVSRKEKNILWEIQLQTDRVPVSNVYRFLDRRGGSPLGSPTVLLTFNIPHLPYNVYLGFKKFDV